MKCCCEDKRMALFSGVKGILLSPRDGRTPRAIERCDACERFPSDEAAGIQYATIKGGRVRYDKQLTVLWTPSR